MCKYVNSLFCLFFLPLLVSAQLVYNSGLRSEWKPFPGNPQVTIANIELGYFDSDRKVDLVRTVKGRTATYLYEYFSSETQAWVGITESNVPMGSVKIADFNGDGISDLLTSFNGTWNLCDGSVQGCSWDPGSYSGQSFSALDIGDFDGDGVMELFSVQNGAFRVSKWNGGWRTLSSWSHTLTLILVDVDRDGKTDLLTRINKSRMYRSAGKGNWITLEVTARDEISNSIYGDFDGDGSADMLVNEPNPVKKQGIRYFASGCGDGEIEFYESNLGVDNARYSRHRFPDVDGDGKTDLIASKNTVARATWTVFGDADGWQKDPGINVFNVIPQSFSDDLVPQVESFMAMDLNGANQIFTHVNTNLAPVFVGHAATGWEEVKFSSGFVERPMVDGAMTTDAKGGIYGTHLRIAANGSSAALETWYISKLDGTQKLVPGNFKWPQAIGSGQFDQPKVMYVDWKGTKPKEYLLMAGANHQEATIVRGDYGIKSTGQPVLTNIIYSKVDDRTNKYSLLPNFNAFRLTVSDNQVLYGAYMRPLVATNPRCAVNANRPLVLNSEVVVVRDDDISDPSLFTDLKGAGNLNGAVVTIVPVPTPFYPALGFPNDDALGPRNRLGNDISIAVSPQNPNEVIVAWPQLVNFTNSTSQCPNNESAILQQSIVLAKSTDSGQTWHPFDTIPNATKPKLVVNDQGSVALLCQTYFKGTDLSTSTPWETLLMVWNFGLTDSQYFVLNRWSNPDYYGDANSPFVLGDYLDMQVRGGQFLGVFAGYNEPHLSNFPNGIKYWRDADFLTNSLTYVDKNGNTQEADRSTDLMYFEIKDPFWQGPLPQVEHEEEEPRKGERKKKG